MGFLQSQPTSLSIAPGVSCLFLEDTRFKRVVMHGHLDRPMDARRSARTLLLPVLQQGSAQHPRRLELARELENNFGASLGLHATRMGECHRTSVQLSWVGSHFLPPGIDCMAPMLALSKEILDDPLRGEQADFFLAERVERERAQLLRQIASLQDDRASWAEERFLGHMCADEPYGLPPWGTSEEVASLTQKDLEEARLDLLSRSSVTWIAVGPIKGENVVEALKDWFASNGSAHSSDREELGLPEMRSPSSLKEVREELPMDQARFLMGFRCPTPTDIRAREAMVLACSVLGGGAQGRLFRLIREQRSLAYGIYAGLRSLKGLMVVEAGIDSSSAPEVQEEVLRQVSDLASSPPSQEELEVARVGILQQLQSVGDSPQSLLSYWNREAALGLSRTPAERAAALQAVTPEAVSEAASLWVADTSYLLSGPEETQ